MSSNIQPRRTLSVRAARGHQIKIVGVDEGAHRVPREVKRHWGVGTRDQWWKKADQGRGPRMKTPPEEARQRVGQGKKREKQQSQKYPELRSPTCTLRKAAAPPPPHALVPHAASASVHSTARASTRHRCRQGDEATVRLPALPLRALHHTGGAEEVTPPATSPARPHCHSFPSLCLRLANHQAASVGTGIIDRRHQPTIARQGAVRALLKRATILNTAGARGAAAWGGAPAKAVGVPRDRPEGGG